MGFDLQSDSGAYERFSPSGWGLLQALMKQYGWTPACTTQDPLTAKEREEIIAEGEDPDNLEVWEGGYDSNDHQRVSTADAQAMATACQNALADPNCTAQLVSFLERIYRRAPKPLPELQAEAQTFRERLTQFIAFCNQGTFRIC